MRYGLLPLGIVVGAALAWLYTPDKRRAELETIYARPPSIFIEVTGIRLHVRDTGPKTAPALIFLHGFGSSLQTWDKRAQTRSGPSGHPLRSTRFRADGG